jgi:hypothetical protein
MNEEHKMPECKTLTDLFYRYRYQVFGPMVEDMGKGIVYVDEMAGTIHWSMKDGSVVSATPLWEDELNTITVDLDVDHDGTFKTLGKIDYPLNKWTMNPTKDVTNYIGAVRLFLRSKGIKV